MLMARLEQHPLAGRFNRLLPEHVYGAVEAGGRRCTGRFVVLNSYENRVYQLELDDGSFVVGKFYRPGRWSREAILDEHRFLRELDEAEVPVAVPIELTPGETLGEVDGIAYALFARLGGRAPEELDDEQVRMAGRLIARIHNVGARADAPHRMRLSPDTYGADDLRWLLEHDAIPAEARAAYAATVEALLARMRPRFEGVPVHRLHGDCHLGNLLWTPRGPAILDFDDMLVGPPVQDGWLLVGAYDAEGQRQRRLLFEAYGELRRFEPAWLRLVEPLRALRIIHYAAWIARRWEDPSFKRTFGHFGTLQFWEAEIAALREQIARIDQED